MALVTVTPDPKPAGRVRDPDLLRALHLEWRSCVLCGASRGFIGLSLHHVHKHPRDDVRENLVMLCGDGVRGCHGKVEAHDPDVCRALADYLVDIRPTTILYLEAKLGGSLQVAAWLVSQLYYVPVPEARLGA